MSRLKVQLAALGGMVVITFLLHVFLFGEAGYFTRQKLQDRLHAIRGQIEELETENRTLEEEYAKVEETPAARSSAPGATILTFETNTQADPAMFSAKMERTLADPETVFFLMMSLLSASGMVLLRMLPVGRKSF